MKDILNQIMSKIIDEFGRESMIVFAFTHRPEASPTLCHQMEVQIRRCVRIDGFRDASTHGIPVTKVLNKLVPASELYPSLERSIIDVWADLKAPLKSLVLKKLQSKQDISFMFMGDSFEKEVNIRNHIEKIARELSGNHSYPLEEVRLMVIYTIIDTISHKESVEEVINGTHIKNEEMNGGNGSEKVNLEQWLSALQSLSATSEIWDEIQSFIGLVSKLADENIQERKQVKRLEQALQKLKQSYQRELDFFELTDCVNLVPGNLDLKQSEDLANKTERLIMLFEQHLEIRAGESFARTVREAELKRRAIFDLENEIKQICYGQSGDLEKHNKDNVNELDFQIIEEEIVKLEPESSYNSGLDNIPSNDSTAQETRLPEGTLPVLADETIPEISAGEELSNSTLPMDQNQECYTTIQSIPHSDSNENNLCIEPVEEIVSSCDVPAAFNEMAGASNEGELESEFSEIPSIKELQRVWVPSEPCMVEGDIEILPDPVSFELLYEEIKNACINVEDLPRAWIFYKACRELYGNQSDLEVLPTPTLMELYYLSWQIYKEPILYTTRRKRLDQLAGEIKIAELSKAQAVMHFAVSLPLVLAHAYDPLRASFFYSEYIPYNLEQMYSMLVEHTTKVNVPIINLCGAEQKQQQNEEQRKKLGEKIEQAFTQYSAKNKTRVDAYFFPRYGKGPLQWIRDRIGSQSCSDEFRARLEETTVEDVFALFTGQRDISVSDQKLANITAVREGALDRIQHILNLASAWVASCNEVKPLDDFYYKAFKQLQLLFDENYDCWIEDLNGQKGELMIASCWMKQGLEQVLEYVRGVKNEVEYPEQLEKGL